MLAVSLQGRGGPPPPTSAVRAYAPLISDLLPQRFEPHLQPSNVPASLPQIPALPLQPLALILPPLSFVSLQGRGFVPIICTIRSEERRGVADRGAGTFEGRIGGTPC